MDLRNNRGCGFLAGLLLVVFAYTFSGLPYSFPRPVSALAPTPPAGPATARFGAAGTNTQAPDGTIQQIDLRLIGGGYPGCLDIAEEPTLDYYNDNLDLTGIAMIATCGWKEGETVRVTLMDPMGKITTREVKAVPARQKKGAFEVDVFYQPGADALPGKYRFTLQGSGTVKAKITYARPGKARLYLVPADPFQPEFAAQGGKHTLRLDGFLPNEPVRLLAYRVEGTLNQFYGWQDFTTDTRGQLIIETDIPQPQPDAAGKDTAGKDTAGKDTAGKDTAVKDAAANNAAANNATAKVAATTFAGMNYFVYGRDTHFIAMERFTRDASSITRRFDMDLYCPGALAPRLSGPAAIRLVTGTTRMDIRQQPGFGSRVIAQISAGDPLRTFGYPKCIDRAFWWQISMQKTPLFGWAAESFLGKYLVEPVE